MSELTNAATATPGAEPAKEVFDEGLQKIFGTRYQDGSNEKQVAKEKHSRKQTTREAQDAQWEAMDEMCFMDKLFAAGKCALIFGGLTLLFFYWQQTGQMQPSAALPCMCACTLMVGWGIGKHVAK